MDRAPLFIKALVRISIEETKLEFANQNLSVTGMSGLPWAPLSPQRHFGRIVSVDIQTATQEPIRLIAQARLLRERTIRAEQMALRFHFTEEQTSALSELIAKEGFYPTEYARKYPRIPSLRSIQIFPMQAVGAPTGRAQGATVTFDVGNLSPNGVLLITESSLAQNIQPGQILDLALEPRGWFPKQVRVEGLVCRVVEDMHPRTKNVVRSYGIKFARMDEQNKAAFLTMLADILQQLKKQRA